MPLASRQIPASLIFSRFLEQVVVKTGVGEIVLIAFICSYWYEGRWVVWVPEIHKDWVKCELVMVLKGVVSC